MSKQRLYYIDNLRIFLISLVVLHHFAITYGAPGSWYYNESQAGSFEALPMSMFVATNQSFFMGMFFFISAFFIVPSLLRKGTSTFLKDRFIRLGIPLLVFFFILSPLTIFILNRFVQGADISLLSYITSLNKTGFGPLWFVEALLIFTLLYLIIRPLKFHIKLKFPKTAVILLFAFFTGLLQYIIRLGLPVGWSMPFTNFQFPFFMQYIFLFVLGIIAWQNNWLEAITPKMGKQWFWFTQVLVFIGFPLLLILGGAAESGTENFMGGMKWQSLGYAMWEQFTGISMIIGLIGIFKKRFNSQGKIARHLSESAYGVFVFHTPVIVGISAVFIGWQIFPPLKLIILAPLALFSCFLLAWLLKQIPGVNKIL